MTATWYLRDMYLRATAGERDALMRYTFGECVFDLQRQELWRAGQAIALRPKVFQLLRYLVHHHDRVVPKAEVLEQIWPAQYIGDAALNSCLKELRQAVGDTGSGQQIIQTLRGRGYRLVAAVHAVEAAAPAEAAVPEAPVTALASVSPTTGMAEEHRTVTLLACTVPDAALRAHALGAERLYLLMQTVLQQAEQAIQRYAGTMLFWGSDSCTAVFGAPVAYEDHAWRALLAAHELRERLRQPLTLPDDRTALRLSVALALHTGPVIIGSLPQAPQTLYTAAGPTTHRLAHLQRLAEPGQLVISAATYGHVRTAVHAHAWGALPEAPDGAASPVYLVHALTPQHQARPPARVHPRSRFVGRERELALLQAGLEQALQGHGQVISLIGEAGIGKSRLLDEWCQRLPHGAVMRALGRCLSYGGGMPYVPVRSLLGALCGLRLDAPANTLRTDVQRFLHTVGMATPEWLPYLQQLLGLPDDDNVLARLSPEAVQRRTDAAVRHLVLTLSQRTPLVLIIEDAHWIDRTSEALWATLMESLAGARILCLVTARPGYRPPWAAHSYASQLALPALSPQQSAQLLTALVAEHPVSPDVLPALLAKAEGNPFFLEELTQAMLAHDRTAPTLPLPDTVQGVVMARLDQLPSPAKYALQLAALLGRTVSPTLLAMVWDGPGDLEEHLELLQRREFLYAQVTPPPLTYTFKHALGQEVAYHSLLHSRRQLLHTRVGQALETFYATEPDAVLAPLAYHYGRSTDAAKAIAYLGRMAAHAARRHAHVEALEAVQQALAHVEHLPASAQDRTRLDLLLRQAFSLSVLGRFRDITASLEPQRACVARLQDPTLTGPYHFRLGMTAFYAGAYAQAHQHAQAALTAAQQCADTVTQGITYYLLSLVKHATGTWPASVEHARHAVTCLTGTEEWHWLGLAYWSLGITTFFLGEFDTASAALAQTRALGVTHEDRRLRHFADAYHAWLLLQRGQWQQSIAVSHGVLAEDPDPIAALSVQQSLGLALRAQGDPRQATALLTSALQRAQQRQLHNFAARLGAFLAEALLAAQQYEAAQHQAEEALTVSRTIGAAHSMGLAQRVVGRLAQARGDTMAATAALHAALDTFTALHARYDLAWTHLDLAECAAQQADPAALRTHLDAACHLFQRIGISTHLAHTTALAQALMALDPATAALPLASPG